MFSGLRDALQIEIRFILMGELNKSITQETNLELTMGIWGGVRLFFLDEHPSLKLELEYV